MDSRKTLGWDGESVAMAFLERRGIRILKRNFHCRMGEIDIIAREGNTFLVIEVKTRTGAGQGSPAEAVDYRKQDKICRAFDYYRMCRHLHDGIAVRFDVIEVNQHMECRWIRNAFDYIEGY